MSSTTLYGIHFQSATPTLISPYKRVSLRVSIGKRAFLAFLLFFIEFDGGVPLCLKNMNGVGREQFKAKAQSGEQLHHPHNKKWNILVCNSQDSSQQYATKMYMAHKKFYRKRLQASKDIAGWSRKNSPLFYIEPVYPRKFVWRTQDVYFLVLFL